MNYFRDQKGFTLVELAVVMIIIGLLIGGILKGQELIANAQVASTVTQMKGIDAAMNTFRDSYSATPGDMLTATSRLPGCSATTNCGNGTGDGRINVLPGAVQGNFGNNAENFQIWRHLSAGDLLGGVDNSNIVAFGNALPQASIGGGFTIGYHPGGVALNGQPSGPNPRAGHYLALTGTPSVQVGGAGTAVLNASQAARLDRKLDDGVPETGSVIFAEDTSSGASSCDVSVNGVNVYDEAKAPDSCLVYFRIQQ